MGHKTKIALLIALFLSIVMFATIGYYILLDLTLVDALYMTVITISTVGYTEVTEMTDQAKVFSIVVIMFSVGTAGYILSTAFRFLSESLFNDTWKVKKMEKKIAELKHHYIVCGVGETGEHVVKHLQSNYVPFVVIDNNETVIKHLIDNDVPAIHGDATMEETLEKANIDKAKGLVSTLSKDADNVFVVLTAREMNKNLHIVARAYEDSSYKKLRRAGANNTVSPNEIGGKKIAAMMLKPSLSHFMDHIIDTGNISINLEEVMIHENSKLCQMTLKEAKISEKTGLIILAIRKEVKDAFIFNPKGNYVLQPNDFMIVVGEKEQIEHLNELAKVE